MEGAIINSAMETKYLDRFQIYWHTAASYHVFQGLLLFNAKKKTLHGLVYFLGTRKCFFKLISIVIFRYLYIDLPTKNILIRRTSARGFLVQVDGSILP